MSGLFSRYASYYDLLYKDKDYSREAAYVCDLLGQYGVVSGRILDLGSGTGRHAQELARRGFDVMGIDASREMIDVSISATPMELRNRLLFQRGDVRSFRCGKRFDAVISLFHVMSYQRDNNDVQAALVTAAEHLKDGGILIFDVWHGPAVVAIRPSARIKRIEDDCMLLVRSAQPELDEDRELVAVTYTMTVTCRRSGRVIEAFEECHTMRYFQPLHLRHILEKTGFSLLGAFEWETGRPLSAATWSATYIASKA